MNRRQQILMENRFVRLAPENALQVSEASSSNSGRCSSSAPR